MSIFSNVVGYLVDKYRGSSNDVAIHQIESGAKPETSLSCLGPGIEINPANGENLVITKIKNSSSFVVSIGGVNQNIAPDTDRGERRIYSVSENGETIQAIAKFKNDGTLELNGATDSAVLFSKLQTEFNKLNSKYDDLVTKYNAHTHPYVDTPIGASVTSPTTSSGTPSDADISQAESADVKLS